MNNPEGEVHTLISGRPPCGFSDDVPGNWPPGHRWTDYRDVKNITCPDCREAAEKLQRSE
jgi:hypothetical protein